MILLDTDHFSVVLAPWQSQHSGLMSRILASSDQSIFVSAPSLEEQLKGWLNQINQQSIEKQVVPYAKLVELVDFYSRWTILPFNTQAAATFKDLRKQKVNIGTQDLKIASVALVHGATLVTANTVDFEKVPGLQFEDWLH